MKRLPPLLAVFFLGLLQADRVQSACQSCLLPALHRYRPQYHVTVPTSVAIVLQQKRATCLFASLSGLALDVKSAQKTWVRPGLMAASVIAASRLSNSIVRAIEGAAQKEQTEKDENEDHEVEEKPVTSAMVATIGVYKNFISPLLPPACRFVPTCSQYGVQAIEEFGPTKGAVLTAWRLLRCSPLGGKGYDPPKWPPVSYTYASY